MDTRRLRRVIVISVAIIAILAVLVKTELVPGDDILASCFLALLSLGSPLVLIQKLVSVTQEPTAEQHLGELKQMIHRVWIDGVLADTLRDAQLDISVAPSPEKVGQASNYANYQALTTQLQTRSQTGIIQLVRTVLLRRNAVPEPIPNTLDAVLHAFNNTGRKLLILGAPGSGKSVLLLQLADHLLADEKSAVPVVLNLGSWTIKSQTLADWIVAELQRGAYRISKNLAQKLINTDKLIYLLDGLDEVAEAHRDDCVRAINAFLAPERQLVICSRTEEYQALAGKLDLHYAIEMQPLSEADFEAYLATNIPEETVARIMAMLRAEADVWQEANKPLFLNILISTYRDGRPFQEPTRAGTALRQVQATVIEPYVTRQLQQAPVDAPFGTADTRRYLAWLGWQMSQRNLTTFHVEDLQPDWLFDKAIWIFPVAFAFVGALIFGVVGASAFKFDLSSTLIFVAVGALIGISKIDLSQKLVWPGIKNIKWGRILALALVGFVVGLGYGLYGSRFVGLEVGLLAGLVIGTFLSLIFALIGLLSGDNPITQRTAPNQGLSDAIVFGLVTGLIGGLIVGMFVDLGLGLIAGLIIGLSSVIKHVTLRLLLRLNGAAPRRFVLLLLYAKDRRLMRPVGGSFIFVHRYVQNYFASQHKQT